MQGAKLYEYAVIRLVPRVEREEFFNIGLVLFSKKEKYIRVKFHICPQKFLAMNCEVSLDEITQTLTHFTQVAQGGKAGGPIAQLDIPERFRWLTAVRSAIIQTSRPHPGKTADLDGTFEELFREMVG